MKEATINVTVNGADNPVSIHASMKEATGIPPDLSQSKSCFNPRLHEGGDQI